MARFPPTQSDPPAAKAATPLRTGWRPHTVRAFRSGTNIAMEVALKGLAFARERSGNRDRSARARRDRLARTGGVKSPGELPFYGLLGLRELTVELALRNGQMGLVDGG